MHAIVADFKIEWNAGIIASSVIIALVASVAGYWILFRLISLYPRREILRLASALVIATAVTSMHYSGTNLSLYIILLMLMRKRI
jgi:NO-binding membrane sensor protein with MHYT domain